MANGKLQEQAESYTDGQVMEPAFQFRSGVADGQEYRDLMMQTFVEEDMQNRRWQSEPENKWHLLARVFSDRIVTYPVFTNPHAQRYLSTRHGRFATVVYERRVVNTLPDSPDALVSDIELALPWRSSNPCTYGLGFIKELDEVWLGLSRFPNLNTLVVARDGEARIDGNTVRIPEEDIDQIRRAFSREARRMRGYFRQSKSIHIRNALLAPLDPERFPPIVQVAKSGELMEVRLDRGKQSKAAGRAARKAVVEAVRSNVETLAAEAPKELLELHAEIERVTLEQMIEKYEDMLQKNLTEPVWQKFFERNIFILTMVFARPVRLLHAQFHARGGGLDGTGAQIGDFLLAEKGFAMAIVEIKRPSSPLLREKAYRNREVFAPDEELSGAVSQVLYQQSKFHENWLFHQSRPELQNSRPEAIKCVVISGVLPTNEMQRQSLEVFRNACKNVEIITFDELLGKLQLLLKHLTPHAPPQLTTPEDDVPF
ncbi:Shedu immune nuclease family protein [Achromobacter xylosoxidans]